MREAAFDRFVRTVGLLVPPSLAFVLGASDESSFVWPTLGWGLAAVVTFSRLGRLSEAAAEGSRRLFRFAFGLSLLNFAGVATLQHFALGSIGLGGAPAISAVAVLLSTFAVLEGLRRELDARASALQLRVRLGADAVEAARPWLQVRARIGLAWPILFVAATSVFLAVSRVAPWSKAAVLGVATTALLGASLHIILERATRWIVSGVVSSLEPVEGPLRFEVGHPIPEAPRDGLAFEERPDDRVVGGFPDIESTP